MAKGRKKVSSKQATGRVRQRQLLASSACRTHGIAAVITKQTGNGTYVHVCEACLHMRKDVSITKGATGTQLLILLMEGK